MSRPYISSGIQELETLFTAHRQNSHILKHLYEELKHRSTKRARSLLALVEQRLATFESHGEQDLSAAPPETSPGGAQPPSPRNLFPGDEFFGSHPDDQQKPDRLVLMRPPGTAGLPDPWLRPLGHDISLPITEDADLPDRFTAALNALISEIKKTGSGQRRYELERGVLSESPGGEYIYVFPFTDQAELFEEAQVELQLAGRRIEGSIVSISAGRLVIAVKEDLGATIHQAALVIDATALLEALVEKLEQVKKGEVSLNRDLADAVAGFKPEPRAPDPITGRITSQARGDLNVTQVRAHERALTDAVTWIWGPPGCGKTKTLGEIVRSAFENERRVLVEYQQGRGPSYLGSL